MGGGNRKTAVMGNCVCDVRYEIRINKKIKVKNMFTQLKSKIN